MAAPADTTAEEPATETATCRGLTKTGRRCRRAARPGSDYCAQHASQQPRDLPDDIDQDALDAAIRDLTSGTGSSDRSSARDDAQSAADRATAALDELRGVGDFLSENAARVRDAAVDAGVVEAEVADSFMHDLALAGASLARGFGERLAGDYEEDEFGFDERFTMRLLPLANLLYKYWWRVDVEGIDNVPATGRGMLVCNHAGGGIPFDGAMVKTAMMLEREDPRHVRLLVLDWLMGLPFLADLMRRTGQVLACSPNAHELLKRDELIAVFPEGVKGMAKPFSERYQLQRFGRGGFVRIALRDGAPIVPVAIVGSEEIYPKIGNIPVVNKLIGAPFVPMTPLFPWFGLAGVIPLPSKWHIEFCEPIDVSGYPPEAAEDRAFVLELSERVRATIQERLRENLLKRTTPFW